MMPSIAQFLAKTFPVLLIVMSAFTLHASHFEAGEEVIIKNRITDNAYISGGEVAIEAPIAGDLITAGGKIHVRDSIYQDIIAAGGSVDIYKSVGGDVRLTGGSVRIYRSVQGDVVVMGGEVEIEKDAVIGGDVIVFAGSVRIGGAVKGTVRASCGELTIEGPVREGLKLNCGSVTINGAIAGSSTIQAGELNLRENASFSDDVRYWTEAGKQDLSSRMEGGARATYDETLAQSDFDFNWLTLGMGAVLFFLLRFLAALLVIVFVLLLLTGFFRKAAQNYDRQWLRSIGFGLLYLFVLPIVSLVLVMTVVGLPLGLFSLGVYGLSLLILPAVVCAVTAFVLERYYSAHWGFGRLLMISVGLYVLFRILMWIPFLGIPLWIAFIAWGVGIMLLGLGKNKNSNAEQYV